MSGSPIVVMRKDPARHEGITPQNRLIPHGHRQGDAMSNALTGLLIKRVKAAWLAIRLSQADLAEMLDAAFQEAAKTATVKWS
jgi:hypothetical protein